MMKKLVLVLAVMGMTAPANSESLFNGKDLSGWHVDVPKMDKDPGVVNPITKLSE